MSALADRFMRPAISLLICVICAGCSLFYYSPGVREEVTETTEVKVIPITAESLIAANSAPYTPKQLPNVFSNVAGAPNVTSAALENVAPYRQLQRPRSIETRLPTQKPAQPYRIGIGDIVMLATPDSQNVIYEINGLLAAQSSRQGYTVQDDGAVAIPKVGRVTIAGLTLAQAQNLLFNRFVENQVEPSFSLEIAEFRSQKVAVDGAVRLPVIEPITLAPLYLDEAITAAGGIDSPDIDYVAIKLYRDGKTYQVPASTLFAGQNEPKILLQDGDRVYVEDEYSLELADGYLNQQIKLTELHRASLEEERANFDAKVKYDAIDRDYVYRFGEVERQGSYPLPFGRTASMADVLFNDGGMNRVSGDVRRIYVLRQNPSAPGSDNITAWSLNAQNAPKLLLATQFEMRPNDIIFIATHPISDWNRVISQMLPTFSVVGIGGGFVNDVGFVE